MIDRTKHAKQLPDGTYVTGVFAAAKEYGTTPPAFLAAAKKAGLKRYATRTSKGQVAHYWECDAIEELARQRFGNGISVDTDSEFVELPYEAEGN